MEALNNLNIIVGIISSIVTIIGAIGGLILRKRHAAQATSFYQAPKSAKPSRRELSSAGEDLTFGCATIGFILGGLLALVLIIALFYSLVTNNYQVFIAAILTGFCYVACFFTFIILIRLFFEEDAD